ncbi:MAG TPA: carboxypeptidase-like regulatory domain-containing protein [Kofleriaceae bacterium]|nr:carboxypeptidase-like regulatory domain-containing protein [Kofleriaceae bacterium]
MHRAVAPTLFIAGSGPAVALALVLAAGCTAETAPQGDASPSGVDGGQGGSDAGGPVDCDDLDPQAAMRTGNHADDYDYDLGGNGCMGGLCHKNGMGPTWTVAGTLVDGIGGGEPIAGAHIYLVDGGGREYHLTTGRNGQFWTNQPVSFPVTTYATLCPDRKQMTITATSGNCNGSSGGVCHPSSNRIYLTVP